MDGLKQMAQNVSMAELTRIYSLCDGVPTAQWNSTASSSAWHSIPPLSSIFETRPKTVSAYTRKKNVRM